MAKKFSLGDYLKAPEGVSNLDTGAEQLRYIPLDLIDPDPNNFYSLEGLEELAGNIELIGLQQPLRVRPNGERWTIVSGHRRRAAILLIRDGGNPMFDGGVPCLVDYGEASDAMLELRLIFANSATRVLSSAEKSRQAERVTELLYQLKEQGVEFPGRMRDHVAEACHVSASTLARLHAIRERLDPILLAEYDAGRINEAVAYRISQEDTDVQRNLAKAPAIARGATAEYIGQVIERLKKQTAGQSEKQAPPLDLGWDAEAYMEERRREDEFFRECLWVEAPRFLQHLVGIRTRQNGIEMLKQALGKDHHGWWINDFSVNCSPKGVRFWDGDDREICRTWTDVYDMLCTLALSRTAAARDDGREAAPGWMTGEPPRDGRYYARIDMGDGGVHEAVGAYQGGSWSVFNGPLYDTMRVVGWWPLPEKEV